MMNTVDEFWSNVDIRGPDECWPWKGGASDNGYGNVWWQGRRDKAHRVAYKLEHPEENIDDLHVHHKDCETKLCCNTAHLEPHTRLTHAEQHLKTHCKHGHEFTPENTYYKSDWTRQCRECRSRRMKEYYERQRKEKVK